MPRKPVRKWRLLEKSQCQSKSCLHRLFDVKLLWTLRGAELALCATQMQGNLPGQVERLFSVQATGEKGLVTSSSGGDDEEERPGLWVSLYVVLNGVALVCKNQGKAGAGHILVLMKHFPIYG